MLFRWRNGFAGCHFSWIAESA